MALFSRNKKEEKKPEVKPAATSAAHVQTSSPSLYSLAHVLKHARITEKASMQQGFAVYTFDVAQSATKREVMAAVQALYKVMPRKVAIVQVPSKARRSMKTGKSGIKRGGKKAYVYLVSGQSINL